MTPEFDGGPGVSRETPIDESAAAPAGPARPGPQTPQAGRPLPHPADTRLVVVANQKGGVGKTTTAVNLAAALAQAGQEVLVIDMDPQGNASTALSVPHDPGTLNVYDVLVNGKSCSDVVAPVPQLPGLWAIPATVDLAGAEIELVSQVARENRLRKALLSYLPEHAQRHRRLDYVIVDCPPSLGLLTLNALVAGVELLIPLQSEYYALEGLGHLLGSVGLVQEHLNPDLRISAILLTMYDGRTKLAPQVADEVRTHFPDQVMTTVIPRSVRVSEAPSYGQTVLQYDPGSPGAKAYEAAAQEFGQQRLPDPSADDPQPIHSPGPAVPKDEMPEMPELAGEKDHQSDTSHHSDAD